MRFESGPVSMTAIGMIFVVGIALPIMAHHVHPANTFNDTYSDVQGIVKEVRFRPPHVWIMLEVKGRWRSSRRMSIRRARSGRFLKSRATRHGLSNAARCIASRDRNVTWLSLITVDADSLKPFQHRHDVGDQC
jgi:hypothetical protein